MAKKKARGSKSQAIRDYLASNPNATAGEIVPALKKQGVTVTPGLVSNVKSTSGPKRRRKKKGGRKKAARKTAPARNASGQVSFADLQEAKRLADELGGVEEAKQALAALEELR